MQGLRYIKIGIFGVCSLALSVMASESEKAPAKLIAELTAFCQEVVDEEGTNGKPEDAFLLECVNEELEAEGYPKLTSLD